MPKNKEDYVLKKLQKLLDLIEEVYEGEESFLIPPDYLEVRGMIDNISKNHSADIGSLSGMNSLHRRNRLMKKMKIMHKKFFTFDDALEKICKDAYESGEWMAAWETFIHYTDRRGYSNDDVTEYLNSIGIYEYENNEDDNDPDGDFPF